MDRRQISPEELKTLWGSSLIYAKRFADGKTAGVVKRHYNSIIIYDCDSFGYEDQW